MAWMEKRLDRKAIAASALLLTLYSVTAAQAYPVRLTRPWRAGDRYRISGTGSFSQYLGGRFLSTGNDGIYDLKVELLADATVLEIRADGRIAKESLTIDHCLITKRDRRKELIPKGTVVVASVESGDQVFRLDGQAVDREAQNALSMVVSLDPLETNEDEVFGSLKERKVGEHWAINATAAARWLGQSHADSKQNNLRGSATIKRRVTIGNIECLVINYSIEAWRFSGAVSGSRLDNGELQVAISGTFPIDSTQHGREQSRQVTIHTVTGTIPDPRLPEIVIDMTIEMRMSAHYTAL